LSRRVDSPDRAAKRSITSGNGELMELVSGLCRAIEVEMKAISSHQEYPLP